MNNSVSKLLLALALTTSSAAFVFSSANAVEGESLTGRANARQIVVQKKDNKADDVEIVADAKLENSPLSQNIVVVDKQDKVEKTPEKKDEIIEEVPTDLVDNTDNTPEIEKTPEIVDEDVFAPQVKTKVAKVEMPTIFTEKQQTLFKALSNDDQTTLVKSLIKKYGYNTLYPAKVAKKDYKTYSNYHSQRKYHDSYNNNYNSSYNDGYRYSNQSNYHDSYSTHSNGCAK